jgi:nitrate/nitrite transport system ATP-binding protein
MAILELDHVYKSYGGTKVLSDVSLSVETGEVVAIVGFSGAGKTTLMSLLTGLEKPDQGRALFKGQAITGPSAERGVVFQNYSLLPWLSAFENVELAVREVFSAQSRSEQRDRVTKYLEMVGLGHARDRRPAALSGGMRQRVSLARALAIEPEVLLMDEPLSALDALTRATLQDEIERIARTSGKTIVIVTNDVDEAILIADRIVPLSAGPSATLGESTTVEIARPRERKALNHDKHFREIRASLTAYLLETQRVRRARAAAGAPTVSDPGVPLESPA